MDTENEIRKSLRSLQESTEEFIDFYQKQYDFSAMINTSWNAKDILGHITFWHESFARNINSLGNQQKPDVLRGKLSEVNQLSVQTTAKHSILHLLKKLQTSQNTIEYHIFNKEISLIPCSKKGSRDYTRKEHLDIVCNHVSRHLEELKKKIKWQDPNQNPN